MLKKNKLKKKTTTKKHRVRLKNTSILPCQVTDLKFEEKVTKSLCLTGFLLIFTHIGILQKCDPAIVHTLADEAQENIRVFLKNKLQG